MQTLRSEVSKRRLEEEIRICRVANLEFFRKKSFLQPLKEKKKSDSKEKYEKWHPLYEVMVTDTDGMENRPKEGTKT